MNKILDIELHLESFAEAFVLDARKDKWRNLLRERPDNILSQSTKFFNYLDHNYIEQDNALTKVSADDTVGVFYDFIDEPKCVSFAEAKQLGKLHDAIFSIQPGKLAVYFYHEGWNFVCRKQD